MMKRIFEAANQEEHMALRFRNEVAKFIRLDGLELYAALSEWPTYCLIITDGYVYAQQRITVQRVDDKFYIAHVADCLVTVWARERYLIKS